MKKDLISMLRCDLHVHSKYSGDSESSIPEILSYAARAGLDAIAITDHDTTEGAVEALGYPSPVLVIPGVEVSTLQGHLLVLGVEEAPPPGREFSRTVEAARRLGGLCILPHPFHLLRHGAGNRFAEVDAVETFNSRYITGSANRKAARLARACGIPQVGGSDAHVAGLVGYGYTLVDAEPDCRDILRAIREGRCRPGGRMTPISAYSRQSMENLVRKVRRRLVR
ncbi:MAG: PHP domain-containing protein [Methanoculleaceae archaeon]